ncbi:MAG: DNA alkylation repair protein [Bdellovibrionaceae bacterium]|nr:DNA alkylation repair protein [Pseudobdellovibrionaceae bacterium]
MSESSYQLKNSIDPHFVGQLSQELRKHCSLFDGTAFKKTTLHKQWSQLELKQRIETVARNIHAHLSLTYPQQIDVLMKVAPQFQGLQGLVFPEFVSLFGLQNEKTSLKALKFFTHFSTSEFAIRHFIRQNTPSTMKHMQEWSKDKNEHIRRLSSEGCRPRLPWSFKLPELIADPSRSVQILENLIEDGSLYVRKSVANHLNDISKDHPELALKLATRWLKNKNDHTRWIVKHGLRTLLKARNPEALKLFGVHNANHISVHKFKTTKKQFKIGEHVEFSFELKNSSQASKDLRIEYVIHYVKKSGGQSAKVFKLAEKTFPSGTHSLQRRHPLKPMTTRQHYPGTHKIEIVVNGTRLTTTTFVLKK